MLRELRPPASTVPPTRIGRNKGPESKPAAIIQARTLRMVSAPRNRTAPSPLLVGLGITDREQTGPSVVLPDVGTLQRGDFRDPKHGVGHDRDQGRVTERGKGSRLDGHDEGRHDVRHLPTDPFDLTPAPLSPLAPEPGQDPIRGRPHRGRCARGPGMKADGGHDHVGCGWGLAPMKQRGEVAGKPNVREAGIVFVQVVPANAAGRLDRRGACSSTGRRRRDRRFSREHRPGMNRNPGRRSNRSGHWNGGRADGGWQVSGRTSSLRFSPMGHVH